MSRPRPRARCLGGASRPYAPRRASRAWRARRQSGSPPARRYSRHIRRMRALNSASIGGRPTRRPERKRHHSRHAARCHRRTVAGRTTITASRRELARVASVAISHRSSRRSRGRGAERRSTMSWCRSRRFSAATTACEAKSLANAATTLRRRSITDAILGLRGLAGPAPCARGHSPTRPPSFCGAQAASPAAVRASSG